MKNSPHILFDSTTQSFIYGLQDAVVQRMLDFDFICKRETLSVAGVINPGSAGFMKVFFGAQEILLPIFDSLTDAVKKFPKADVFINFASMRSAYAPSLEALESKSIRTVAIIAEGIPERRTRELIAVAKKNNKVLIGPATVGGVMAGAFKIGNTGGTIEAMLAAKLNRPGSVGFVGKSGGMSNELFNVIAQNADGIVEGMAIGGDRYPGSTLLDHLLRFEANPAIKFMVLLSEVGGDEEYAIVEALKTKKIKKPLVAWVTGTCAKLFPTDVQFGHAGAKAHHEKETAEAKNMALKKAGAIVPNSFDDLGEAIKKVYLSLKKAGKIKDIIEPEAPKLPMDLAQAIQKKLVRRPTNFMSTISDDRGDEPLYAGVPMSEVIRKNMGLGQIISLLWFKKKLPVYATDFIEMILKISADHGPAVAGAHNAIVAARAGKDLVSSLTSGLLTIGPRFGGALDEAAFYFTKAYDSKMTPEAFVKDMKAKNINIPGIGHRVKSLRNPDKRVELLKNYAHKYFKKTPLLDYALEVEQITTQKKDNLILNVDGCIAVLFVDLMRTCGQFTADEVSEAVSSGVLNGLFVLGRSIGIIGHVLDQKRLKQPLYRHPWEDILYG